MAHIRRRKNGSWQVIIRKKNYPDIVRTFLEKGTAAFNSSQQSLAAYSGCFVNSAYLFKSWSTKMA